MPLTVVLELEWVLRAFYRFDTEQTLRVLRHLSGLAHVQVEAANRVLVALDWLADGLEFADALHLAGSAHCTAFRTFDDRRFARRARRLATRPPVIVGSSDAGPEPP